MQKLQLILATLKVQFNAANIKGKEVLNRYLIASKNYSDVNRVTDNKSILNELMTISKNHNASNVLKHERKFQLELGKEFSKA